MGEDSMFLKFDGESSDESDDSYDAEDCNIYKIDAVQNQELYSTSSSSHQSSSG
jgi:hypothetical protein